VRRIFNLYCEGFSVNNIVITLNNENILPPALYKRSRGYKMPDFNKNGVWSHYVVLAMLHNQIYIGNMVSNYAKKGIHMKHLVDNCSGLKI
ncbi:MAG: recombinase family protein, partial [Rickettsia sp.]|nr:recombinase family protein [Rickettsia sp.]